MEPSIAVAAIAAAASIATATLGLVQHRRLGVVKAEVKNSHPTNLREDVDQVLSKLDSVIDGQRRHDSEIAGLRTDLRVERQERLVLADRIEGR